MMRETIGGVIEATRRWGSVWNLRPALAIGPSRLLMRYSNWYSTIYVALSDTGWIAGTGDKHDAELCDVGEHSERVVIWTGTP